MSHAPERTPLLASEYPGALASSQHAAHAAAAMSSAAAADLERQRDEDEAFARRLAEQERADPSYQAAEEGRFLGPIGGGGVVPPARAQVRNSMISNLFTQARVTAISFWAVAAMNLPQVGLITYYSVAEADKFNSCDRPISLWVIFHGLRLFLSVIVAGLPLWDNRRFHPYTIRYRRLTDTMNMMGLAVFIWGNFTVFDSRDCQELNPHIWKLSYALLVLQYIVMLLPCALLMCLAPCVFCCLPLLIRVSGYLPVGVGLRMAGVQGASQTLLDKLPPPKKYERGMFGGAAVTPPRAQPSGNAPPGSPATNHEEPECAICLSNYNVGEEVRQLPCAGAHHFHLRCIDDWLKINACCPLDREPLLPLMTDPSLARDRASRQPAAPSSSSSSSAAAAPSFASSNAGAPRASSPAVRRDPPSAESSTTSYQQDSAGSSRRSSIDEGKEETAALKGLKGARGESF